MRQIKFNTVFQTKEGLKHVCMASLDDAWKRHATFDCPKLAQEFNAASKTLCAAAQWWDLADKMKWPVDNIQTTLRKLGEIAEHEGIERIILPVAEKSPAGKFIARQLREVGGHAMDAVVLHEDDYYVSRLHHFGRIDSRRKTGLDFCMVYRKDM